MNITDEMVERALIRYMAATSFISEIDAQMWLNGLPLAPEHSGDFRDTRHMHMDAMRAALTAAVGDVEKDNTMTDQHPDDLAVDEFSRRMKAKLAKKRADGRGGWEDRNLTSTEFLSRLLREHVEKGDPLDVGNLAMMLCIRGDRIAALGDVGGASGHMRGIRDVAEFLESMQPRIKGLGEAIRLVRQFEAGRDTAALGDVEPLEDVLGELAVSHIGKDTGYLGWLAVVLDPNDDECFGQGETIDAAIRAAVANARGEAE